MFYVASFNKNFFRNVAPEAGHNLKNMVRINKGIQMLISFSKDDSLTKLFVTMNFIHIATVIANDSEFLLLA